MRWAKRELVSNRDNLNGGQGSVYREPYAACIVGFFVLLRIPGLGHLKWEDAPVGTQEGGIPFDSDSAVRNRCVSRLCRPIVNFDRLIVAPSGNVRRREGNVFPRW